MKAELYVVKFLSVIPVLYGNFIFGVRVMNRLKIMMRYRVLFWVFILANIFASNLIYALNFDDRVGIHASEETLSPLGSKVISRVLNNPWRYASFKQKCDIGVSNGRYDDGLKHDEGCNCQGLCDFIRSEDRRSMPSLEEKMQCYRNCPNYVAYKLVPHYLKSNASGPMPLFSECMKKKSRLLISGGGNSYGQALDDARGADSRGDNEKLDNSKSVALDSDMEDDIYNLSKIACFRDFEDYVTEHPYLMYDVDRYLPPIDLISENTEEASLVSCVDRTREKMFSAVHKESRQKMVNHILDIYALNWNKNNALDKMIEMACNDFFTGNGYDHQKSYNIRNMSNYSLVGLAAYGVSLNPVVKVALNIGDLESTSFEGTGDNGVLSMVYNTELKMYSFFSGRRINVNQVLRNNTEEFKLLSDLDELMGDDIFYPRRLFDSSPARFSKLYQLKFSSRFNHLGYFNISGLLDTTESVSDIFMANMCCDNRVRRHRFIWEVYPKHPSGNRYGNANISWYGIVLQPIRKK